MKEIDFFLFVMFSPPSTEIDRFDGDSEKFHFGIFDIQVLFSSRNLFVDL